SVHGHRATFPKHIYHLVSGAWVCNQLDSISSRNRNSYTLPVRVGNRQRRLFQLESSGMHGSLLQCKGLFLVPTLLIPSRPKRFNVAARCGPVSILESL